jgi:flagellar protein FliT
MSSGLLHRYEEIALASREMLEAAQRGDWELVATIEGRCCALIAKLKAAARAEALNPAEKQRRIALLRAILEDDAQIRVRSEPWLRDLEALIGPAGRTAPRTP